MNIHNIESHLKQQQYSFDSKFNDDVIARIKSIKSDWFPKLSWLLSGIAASIVLCLTVTYLQDGSVNYDSILGLSTVNYDNISEYINYL
jgi:hypothetical protein